jgi:hypothetical protein
MRPWLASAATMAFLSAPPPAIAGYWNYGCKGSVGDTAYVFDRNSFLIMPKMLAKGEIAGLTSSQIFAFDADDNNSGLRPVMKFARGAYPDQKVVLTEKSSRKISESHGHIGTREKNLMMTRKTYHYERLGYDDQPEKTDIVMDCLEYEVTAP